MAASYLPPIEPTDQWPGYDYTIDLEGLTYRIVLTYRDRTASWYLDVYDSADVLLVSGKRLSIDYRLLWRHVGRKPADGILACLDTSDQFAEAGFDDLGNRCPFAWIPLADIPAAPVTGFPLTIVKI